MSILSSTNSGKYSALTPELLAHKGYTVHHDGYFEKDKYLKEYTIMIDGIDKLAFMQVSVYPKPNGEGYRYRFPCPRESGYRSVQVNVDTLADLQCFEEYEKELIEDRTILCEEDRNSQRYVKTLCALQALVQKFYDEVLPKKKQHAIYSF